MFFRKNILVLLCAVLAAAGLMSCHSLPAPPGFVSQGSGSAGRIEFASGISQEAQYGLLSWYVDSHGEAARRQAGGAYGLALNARNERGGLLCGDASQELVERYPEFVYVPPVGGVAFLYESLGGRDDFGTMASMLKECRATLLRPKTVEIPVDECLDFLKNSANPKDAESFGLWASSHGEMPLGGADEKNVRRLDECLGAIGVKETILHGMEVARKAYDESDWAQALETLDALSKEVDLSEGLGVIGDFETMAALREMIAREAADSVESVLSLWVEDAMDDAALSSFEIRLSKDFKSWREDDHFQKFLQGAGGDRIRAATYKALMRRRELLKAYFDRTMDSREFLHGIRECRAMLRELQEGGNEKWECYLMHGHGDTLTGILGVYENDLATAGRNFYLQCQRDAAEITNRPAIVVLLGGILREICGEEPLESVERVQSAQAKMSARPALLHLKPGKFLGMDGQTVRTLSEDFKEIFNGMLSELGANRLMALTEDEDSADCRLDDCAVLDFSSGDLEVTTLLTWHRWYEAPVMETTGNLAFSQREMEESITVQTFRRSGHIRMNGVLRGWNGEKGVETNCFANREAVQEKASVPEVHSVFRCEDERDFKPVGAPMELKHERVWSDGEVMDMARRNGLRDFASRVSATALGLLAERTPVPGESALDFVEAQGELASALETVASAADSTEPLSETARSLRETLPGRLTSLLAESLAGRR